MNKIVLFGPPASGKGTQSELLSERLGIPTCSTGAMLRDEIAKGTELGQEADRFLSKGQFLPDDLMIVALRGWLEKNREAFVLDGFPRTVAQARALDAMTGEWGSGLEAAVYLDVSEEILMDRVLKRLQCRKCRRIYRIGDSVDSVEVPCPSCGGVLFRRDDDNEETLHLRLVEYREKTAPLIDYYRETGKFFRINGDQAGELVFKDISAAMSLVSDKEKRQ